MVIINPMGKIFIIVPAYNEAQMIGEILRVFKKIESVQLIVVDDGSTDNTYKIASGQADYVLRHIINRGKGAAVRTGIEAAKIQGAEYVVTADSDGQHAADDIRNIINCAKKEKYDVVLGYRDLSSLTMPFARRVANRFANFFTWIIYGIKVKDSQCGLRCYGSQAINRILTVRDKYEYDTEVLREISRHKLRFAQVPIETRYSNYSQQKKHKQTFSNGLKMFFRMIIFG